ncbi:hypothetical protein SO802_012855 [Lithocarpus litseifolius]|uniref:Bet v I/Major latex protein domain-containing protein n=1 Tax=Lithocarpus litseifolius TaxID=425828 RepID=A0AAW2D4Q9_9ROSI
MEKRCRKWEGTSLLLEGQSEVFKEKVELDDANRSVTQVGIEGEVMKDYKTFKPIYQVVPKGTGSLVKLSIEYEKLREDVPAPNKYVTVMSNDVTKDLDAHIMTA